MCCMESQDAQGTARLRILVLLGPLLSDGKRKRRTRKTYTSFFTLQNFGKRAVKMSAPMVPKKDFNAEEVLDEIRQEVSTYHARSKKEALRSPSFPLLSCSAGVTLSRATD